MASITFVKGTTVTSVWLNETDALVHDIFSAATTDSEARTNLGVAIGSDVQAFDASLLSLAALATAADKFPYTTAADTYAEADLTTAGRALLDDATAAAQATTLGLGTGDSPQFTGIELGAASDTTLTRASAGDVDIEGNAIYRAGGTDVPVADGGTGASTFTDSGVLLGNAAGAIQVTTAGTADEVLTSNGAGVDPTFQTNAALIAIGTPVASTSGTSIDFTSIPSGTKKITISFDGVSTSGTSPLALQIGDSGGVEATGYVGGGVNLLTGNGNSISLATTHYMLVRAVVATGLHGGHVTLVLSNASTNKWAMIGTLLDSVNTVQFSNAGVKSLSAELDRVRITTAGGSDTFDAGEINIQYES